MLIKDIIDEDFTNYKKVSMYIGTAICDFKCCKLANKDKSMCQNSEWINRPTIDIPNEAIVKRYIQNDMSKAAVFSGLEPFLQFSDMYHIISEIRKLSNDDIVIYTGYTKEEIKPYIDALKKIPNIIVKFGAFKPDDLESNSFTSHFDEVLGVQLASPNQYAEKIS